MHNLAEIIESFDEKNYCLHDVEHLRNPEDGVKWLEIIKKCRWYGPYVSTESDDTISYLTG